MDEAVIVIGLIGITVLGAIVGAPQAMIGVLTTLVRRRLGLLVATATALTLLVGYAVSPLPRAAAGTLMLTIPPTRLPIARVDLFMSRAAREEIVQLAVAQRLPPGDYAGEYVMPTSARGLSVWGDVTVIDDPCGQRVFFMTLTGFTPDPYAGFEYVPPSCDPEPDPLGSGAGTAQPIDGPWYWIEAR